MIILTSENEIVGNLAACIALKLIIIILITLARLGPIMCHSAIFILPPSVLKTMLPIDTVIPCFPDKHADAHWLSHNTKVTQSSQIGAGY